MLYSIALPLHSYVTRFLERYYSVVKSWTVWTRSTSTQRPVPGHIAHWTGAAMMDVVYTPFLEYYTHDELITITCSDVRLNQPSDTVFSLSWGTSRYRGDSLGSNVNVVEKFLRFCGLLEIDKTLLVRSLWIWETSSNPTDWRDLGQSSGVEAGWYRADDVPGSTC